MSGAVVVFALLVVVFIVLGLVAVYARRARARAAMERARRHSLEESRQRFRSLVQNASDMLAIVDPQGKVVELTGAANEIVGRDWQRLVGTSLVELAHPNDVSVLEGLLSEASSREAASAEWRIRDGGGSWRDVETVATNLLGDPYVGGLVLTTRDIGERKEFEDRLRHRAFHDPLTHLPNRALFYDRVEHALIRDRGSRRLVGVLFVDLDDFKVVNDTLGHAAGDEVLIRTANRLRGSLRSVDTAARLGGDEFGVLVESAGGLGELVEIARRVARIFEEPFVLHGEEVRVRASTGVALSSRTHDGVDSLLRDADLAMYAVKLNGKGRFQVYDAEIESAMVERIERRESDGEPDRINWFMRTEEQREQILALIEEGGIEPALQPIVDVRSGLVAGYEALSRFADPAGRPPNVIFAQAHRCGLGARLEAEAVRTLLAKPGRPAGAFLSINVSPSALVSEEVQRALPERLDGIVLEVTENELVSEESEVPAALADARERGARIAVDDAGAGYAGLRQLMRLRPDLIKLDGALVGGVRHDFAKAALIESVVRYAGRIGALVCAEGIEQLEDLEMLTELDVTYGQGYALAYPGPGWPAVDPAAAAVCASSLVAHMRNPAAGERPVASGDARLERISAWLASVGSLADLDRIMEPVAAELGADDICLSGYDAADGCVETIATYNWGPDGERFSLERYPMTAQVLESGDCVQVLASDPGADPSEIALMQAEGASSLLMVPVVANGQAVGLLELTRVHEQAWSRIEIQRARVIAYHFGAVMERVVERMPR